MKKTYNLSDEQVYWYRVELNELPDRFRAEGGAVFDKRALMKQENPSCPEEAFLSSGNPVFNQEMLAQWRRRCTPASWIGRLVDDNHSVSWQDDPSGIGLTGNAGYWRVWKHPRHGRQYMIVADVCGGQSDNSASAIRIFDRYSLEVVATFWGRPDPGDLGSEMVKAGYYYNHGLLVPEANNFGAATLERIKAEKYPHVLKMSQLSGEYNDTLGFETSIRTKEQLISSLFNAIDGNQYIEPEVETVNELMNAVRDDRGKVVCRTGLLDRMMATAIGTYCLMHLHVDQENLTPVARESVKEYPRFRQPRTESRNPGRGTGMRGWSPS